MDRLGEAVDLRGPDGRTGAVELEHHGHHTGCAVGPGDLLGHEIDLDPVEQAPDGDHVDAPLTSAVRRRIGRTGHAEQHHDGEQQSPGGTGTGPPDLGRTAGANG